MKYLFGMLLSLLIGFSAVMFATERTPTTSYVVESLGDHLKNVDAVECELLGKTSSNDKIDLCKLGDKVICLVVQDAGFRCHKVRPQPDPVP